MRATSLLVAGLCIPSLIPPAAAQVPLDVPSPVTTISASALVRQRSDISESLLLAITRPRDQPAKAPVGVRVQLPKNFAVSTDILPPGFTLTQKGRTLEVTGPPPDGVEKIETLTTRLRFDFDTRGSLVKELAGRKLKLQFTTADRSTFEIEPVVGLLPRVELRTSLEGALTLPPQVVPGQPFIGMPAPGFRDGTWTVQGARDETGQTDLLIRRLEDALRGLGSPSSNGTRQSGNPVAGIAPSGDEHERIFRFFYEDAWREQLVAAPANWTTVEGQTGCEASISGGSPLTFAGQDACVTGCFPAGRFGFVLDNGVVLIPQAYSPATMVLRVPGDTPAGTHTIRWGDGGGSGQWQFGVLQLQGSIDQNQLWRGQSTVMRLRILGSDQPLPLIVMNQTPSIITVEGGPRQVITTPGGADNAVSRNVTGIRRGDFQIDYRLDYPVCGDATAGK